MKIIKSANRIECKCGCIYEYEKDDIDYSVSSVLTSYLTWNRNYYRNYFVRCPECGNKHDLYSEYYKSE